MLARGHQGWWTRLLVGVVALLACTLLGASIAAAALPPADYYGANVQPVFEGTPLFMPQSSWSDVFATMANDNLLTGRMDAEWKWVEPNAPVNGQHTYDWTVAGEPQESLDTIVGTLAQSGIRMQVVLDEPPSWANGPNTYMAPTYYGDYEAFAAAFASRYGNGGSFWQANPQLPYLPVQQFEIWDEANSNNFWTTVNAATYEPVLVATSAAIHAVDPTAQVLPSIGWPNAASYVSQLYQLGVQGSIQGIALHPYAPDAQSIIALTVAVRQALVSAGDPDLPIYANENGLPASTATYTGQATDAERAATETLAGDALAHSDCGVESYDIYAIVGSGNNTDGLGGGSYFGILNSTTLTPNITGAAVIAAEQRWLGAPAGGLVLCGPGATPTQDLLPLGLQLTHTEPACVSATVTYEGNPLESADLVLLASNNRVDPALSSASGQAQMCVDNNGPNITHFTVYAEASSPVTPASLTAPNIAMSATYTCDVNPADPCTLQTSAPSSASSSPGAGSSASGGHYTLRAKLLHIARKRATLRARLLAPAGEPSTARLRVWLERRGTHRRTLLTKLTLSANEWRTFKVQVSLAVGDRLIVGVAPDKTTGLTALQTDLLATRRAGARSAR
ncbi:MAG: hypothetical protein ABSC56_01490 [Solirubrobacteraceae bacterium]|jgi:hypothetical protein